MKSMWVGAASAHFFAKAKTLVVISSPLWVAALQAENDRLKHEWQVGSPTLLSWQTQE